MTVQTKIRAIAVPASAPLGKPEPVPVSALRASVTYREEWRETRDRLTAEQLKVIDLRGMALRASWAMRGLCREAEKAGVDVTYWRELAAYIEGRASDV